MVGGDFLNIIYVTYGGGHVNMLVPLILEHRNRYPEHRITVLGLTTAGAVLDAHGIPNIGFRHLLRPEDTEAMEIGKKLTQNMTHPKVPYEESCAYLGLSFMDLQNRYGKKTALSMYKEKGRSSFFPLTIMKRFFEQEKPDLVIATNSPRAERAAMETARSMKIPSICIIDLFATLESEWIATEGYGSKVCVLNESVKNFLVKLGRRRNDIVITGNPAFDKLADTSLKKKGDLYRSAQGWGRGDKVILWASQQEPGNESLPREIETRLFDLIDSHPDWHLIVRFHPNEQFSYESTPERVKISKNEELETVLSAVDLVIILTSTVGLEAAIMGKPVISLDISVATPNAPFSKMGISKGINNLKELEETILSLLQSNQYQINYKPGNSVDRIMNVIESMIGKVSSV